MPEVATIIFDNSLVSQNQDYLPSRYVLQKEVIDRLITKIMENDTQSLIGLIPLAQKDPNDILTPTNNRKHLLTFMHKRDLYSKLDLSLALYQAEMSIHRSEYSEKTIFMLLGSPLPDFDEFLADIYNVASKGIIIKIACFGEARDVSGFLQENSSFSNLSVIDVHEDDDFNFKVDDFFTSSSQKYMDPELEEAIKRSLLEK